MSSAVSTIIVLLQHQVRKEAIAAGTIKPGYLLLEDSSAEYKANDAASINGQSLVAIENEVNGDDTTVSYAANDQVQAVAPQLGDVVNLKLKETESVAIGARLESAGDGTVQAETTGGVSMFVAKETVDASAAELFIKAERI